MGNLITLCQWCHKDAPDEPADFFKYASRHLPPTMDKAKEMTKIVINLLRTARPDLLEKGTEQELEEYIDIFFTDVFKTICSNDIDEFGKFMAKMTEKNKP
jgi:hypothetical protein